MADRGNSAPRRSAGLRRRCDGYGYRAKHHALLDRPCPACASSRVGASRTAKVSSFRTS